MGNNKFMLKLYHFVESSSMSKLYPVCFFSTCTHVHDDTDSIFGSFLLQILSVFHSASPLLFSFLKCPSPFLYFLIWHPSNNYIFVERLRCMPVQLPQRIFAFKLWSEFLSGRTRDLQHALRQISRHTWWRTTEKIYTGR